MSFGEPQWFWALVLLPTLLALYVGNEQRRGKLLRQLVAARLQDRLAGTVSLGRRRLRFVLLLLALAALIVSLAQPRWGYTMEQSKRQGRDVLIAIDCSRSMLATDLAPSRLGRAKLAAQDLVSQLQGDRLGLVAFSGTAFLQAPLTIDYGAVLNSLNELDTTIIPRGGTNIAAAVKVAAEAFGKGESDNRCLIIFTDGEELDADGLAAAEEHKDRMRIFTVGLGSADGSLIPIPGKEGSGFVKDENGQIVKSRLDEDRLRKIAEVTRGFYVHLQSGPAEMQQIVRAGLGQMKEQEIDTRLSRRPIERYQWPLATALGLLVLTALVGERRRGLRRATAAAVVVLLFACVPPASAAVWKNPGVERYERGQQPLQKAAESAQREDSEAAQKEIAAAKKEFEGAYQEFARQLKRQPESPALNFNLGAAAFQLGRTDEALLAFGKATLTDNPQLRVDAESNIGSALYRKGAERLLESMKTMKDGKQETLRDWKDGLKHYDAALAVQPDNKRVQGYREFLRQRIEELEKEPPQEEQQQQQQQQDQKNEEKKEQQEKEQQSQGGQQNKEQPPKQGEQKEQQPQPSRNQQSQDQPQDGKGDDKKNESGQAPPPQQQGEDKTTGQEDSSKDGQGTPQSQNGQKQERPAPEPTEPEKKKAGEIKGQGEQQQQPQANPQQEAAAEAEAAREDRMTEAQARLLLESLKGEDQRVPLLKQGERRGAARAVRDW